MVTSGEFSQARRVFGEGSKGADAERAFALTEISLGKRRGQALEVKDMFRKAIQIRINTGP